VPAPAPDREPGLLQGLPGTDRERPRAEPAHPARPGRGLPHRPGGPGMAGAPVTARAVDYADVQGLVRFGHGQLEGASFAVLRVKSRDAARAWLRTAPVASAVAGPPLPGTAL